MTLASNATSASLATHGIVSLCTLQSEINIYPIVCTCPCKGSSIQDWIVNGIQLLSKLYSLFHWRNDLYKDKIKRVAPFIAKHHSILIWLEHTSPACTVSSRLAPSNSSLK